MSGPSTRQICGVWSLRVCSGKRDLMPDALHPNLEGYRVWAEAMKPTLGKLMGGK